MVVNINLIGIKKQFQNTSEFAFLNFHSTPNTSSVFFCKSKRKVDIAPVGMSTFLMCTQHSILRVSRSFSRIFCCISFCTVSPCFHIPLIKAREKTLGSRPGCAMNRLQKKTSDTHLSVTPSWIKLSESTHNATQVFFGFRYPIAGTFSTFVSNGKAYMSCVHVHSAKL